MNLHARDLGRKGGRVTSARKAAAVRRNGRKGGRPSKTKYAIYRMGPTPTFLAVVEAPSRQQALAKHGGDPRHHEAFHRSKVPASHLHHFE